MNQYLVIPFRLPSQNDIISRNRKSPYEGARLKRETEEKISYAIIAAKLRPVTQPCIVHMIFEEPLKGHKRDADNVESAKKFILDALVNSHILQGDAPKYVIGSPSFTRYVDGGAQVLVTIIEDEDEERLRGRLRNASEVITEDER